MGYWSRNEFGELGLGHNDQVNSFTEILTSDVGEISAGGHHSLIVKTDGSLWATGNNSFGQLGDNSFTNFDVWANIVNSSDHTHDNFIKHDNDLNQFTKVIDSNCVRPVAGTLSSFVFKNDGSAYVCGWTRMSYDFTQVYEHEYWDPRYSDVRPISSFTLFGQDFVDIKCEIEHSEDMTDYVKDKEYVNSNGVTWEYANRRFLLVLHKNGNLYGLDHLGNELDYSYYFSGDRPQPYKNLTSTKGDEIGTRYYEYGQGHADKVINFLSLLDTNVSFIGIGKDALFYEKTNNESSYEFPEEENKVQLIAFGVNRAPTRRCFGVWTRRYTKNNFN